MRQRPPKSVYPDKCFETIIAFKLIGHFSDARRPRAILSFDPLEIVTRLIPFIGVMLVSLLVYNTRASDLDS